MVYVPDRKQRASMPCPGERSESGVATKIWPKADNSHGAGIFGVQLSVSGYIVMQCCFLSEQEPLKTMPSIFVIPAC